MDICHVVFVHSPTGGHLGSFHILAVVDSDSVNVECRGLSSFSLDTCLEVNTAGHGVVLFLIF